MPLTRSTPLRRTSFPRRRTPLRQVGAKRARANRIYTLKRRAFLGAHPFCEVAKALAGVGKTSLLQATEVHHVKGRGRYFLDESTWLAVSRAGHRWIHDHPREARAKGVAQMKRPNTAKLQAMVDDFNARFPVGTAVIRYGMINPPRDPTDTTTTSEAWVMGGHSAMVKVDGFAGGQSLEAIRIL